MPAYTVVVICNNGKSKINDWLDYTVDQAVDREDALTKAMAQASAEGALARDCQIITNVREVVNVQLRPWWGD